MRDIDMDAWRAAYRHELAHAHTIRPQGQIETVFFGGGTPSLMSPALIGGLLEDMDALWGLARNAEITLEANPVSAPKAHLQDLQMAGITRLSLGVQAFDDMALKFLGRTHSAADAQAAFLTAQNIFPHASFDLIYARPKQDLSQWQDELMAALALAPQHMSLYQLTIEPDTPFAKLHAAGKWTVPDDELAAALYETTQELTAQAGLPAYEISNHAAIGHECRHNVASWRGGDYLGIGPGAHGRVTSDAGRMATQAIKQPGDWLAAIEAQGHGWQESILLSAEDQKAEAVMLGLRLQEGVALNDLAARGVSLDADRLRAARAQGLLSDDEARLQASAQGRLLLDYVLGCLLA